MAIYKGRGALSNPPPRFLKPEIEPLEDGWYRDELPHSIATQVRPEAARSIITRNDSPDIPFEQSINPYRGCEHGCPYCQSGDTPVLMADGSTRPLAEIRVGDTIYGTVRHGWYRRYVKTQVLAHWSVIKPAHRITLEDGTVLVAGADHRFLTERGWKFVTATQCGTARRPHLTAGNKLMGTGAFAAPPAKDADYRRGYLCGLIRGDAMLGHYSYFRAGRGGGTQHQFRLALHDGEALGRAQDWLRVASVETERFAFCAASNNRRAMQAIRTHAPDRVARVRELIAWPAAPTASWRAGFLAGIFDAEGSYSAGILRISNTDPEIIGWISESLRALDFRFVVEHLPREVTKPIVVVRVVGGLREHLRFFHSVDPAITRKRDIAGQAVKSDAPLGVVRIEPLSGAMRLYDITTGTEDFIANGVVSHNCYARPSHAYMDLSPGIDFETKIFYKADAARLLEQELGARGYVPKPITIGANTDPYQPVERELQRDALAARGARAHPPPGQHHHQGHADPARPGSAALAGARPAGERVRQHHHPRCRAQAHARAARGRRRRRGCAWCRSSAPPAFPPACWSRRSSRRSTIPSSSASWPRSPPPAPCGPATCCCACRTRSRPCSASGSTSTTRARRARHVAGAAARDGRDNDPRFGSRMVGTGPWAQLLRDRFALACKRHGLSTAADARALVRALPAARRGRAVCAGDMNVRSAGVAAKLDAWQKAQGEPRSWPAAAAWSAAPAAAAAGRPQYARVQALSRRPLPLDHPRLANRVVRFDALAARSSRACSARMRSAASALRCARRAASRHFAPWITIWCLNSRARAGRGAERLVVISAVGANAASKNFYLRVKGETEKRAGLAVVPRSRYHAALAAARRRRELRPLELAAQGLLWPVNPLLLGRLARYRGIAAGPSLPLCSARRAAAGAASIATPTEASVSWPPPQRGREARATVTQSALLPPMSCREFGLRHFIARSQWR